MENSLLETTTRVLPLSLDLVFRRLTGLTRKPFACDFQD